MGRGLLVYFVALVLGLAGFIYAEQAGAQQAGRGGSAQETREIDLEQEVEGLFALRCLACHERASVDLEATAVSLAKWMHVVRWVAEGEPTVVTEGEADRVRREYAERIREQIDQIEQDLEALHTLLGP